MRQALHIFRKDIRFLRLEICLLLTLAGVFVWTQINLPRAGWSELLFEAAAIFTIARLIHAEAIPGDRQFWLTRPYRPASLVAAKLLFIAVFICLPLACAQVVLLVQGGFSLTGAIPGLLWSEASLFLFAAIPVVAVAALTATFVPFLLTALFLAFVAFAAPTGAALWMTHVLAVPGSVAWIRILLFEIALVAIAAVVLVYQYARRATAFSRAFAVVALNVAGVLFLMVPKSVPLTMQLWLSKSPALAGPVTISARPQAATRLTGKGTFSGMRIPIVFTARNVPEGAEIRPDSVSVTLSRSGQSWTPEGSYSLNRLSQNRSVAVFETDIPMEDLQYKSLRTSLLGVKGSVYFTLFGDDEVRTANLQNAPANVQDGLQCFKSEYGSGSTLQSSDRGEKGRVYSVACRSFFRWPARLVYAQSGDTRSEFGNTLISYSPLPSDLGTDTLETRVGDRLPEDQVTIVTKKPLAHFKRDFTIENLRMADLEPQPQIFRFVRPPPHQQPARVQLPTPLR